MQIAQKLAGFTAGSRHIKDELWEKEKAELEKQKEIYQRGSKKWN